MFTLKIHSPMTKIKHLLKVEALVEVEIDSRLLIIPPMARISDSDKVFDQLSQTARIIEVTKVLPE